MYTNIEFAGDEYYNQCLCLVQVKQHQFRERFRKDAPFRYSSAAPYSALDKCHLEILQMEDDMNKLYESAHIFEINAPEFKQIKQCRKEVNAKKYFKKLCFWLIKLCIL